MVSLELVVHRSQNTDTGKSSALGYNDELNTVYRCDDNNWCCSRGGNTSTCCGGGNTFPLDQGIAQISNATTFVDGYTIAVKSSLETATIQQAQQPGSTSSPASQSTQQPDKNSTTIASGSTPNTCTNATDSRSSGSSNNGKVVAVGVGVGLGVSIPLIVALAGVLLLLKKEKRAHRRLQQEPGARVNAYATGFDGTERRGFQKLGSAQGIHQLPDSNPTPSAELDGRANATEKD